MSRRIHPRHVRDTVSVAPYSETGWVGSWGTATAVPCQLEESRQLVEASGAVTPVTVTTLRVPPLLGRDVLSLFPLHSRVDADGTTSWVATARPVRRQGQLVYLEVTTGDRMDRFGGTWPVDVVVHSGGGRDADGDPLPRTDQPHTGWLIKPSQSTEPLDFDESALTTATLLAPPGTALAPSASVTVTGSPLAGEWELTGEPAYHPDRTEIPLRRS